MKIDPSHIIINNDGYIYLTSLNGCIELDNA